MTAYIILSNGSIIDICSEPRYIKLSETNGAYVEANEDEAIGLSVRGTLYNLGDNAAIDGASTAIIEAKDVNEHIYRNMIGVQDCQATISEWYDVWDAWLDEEYWVTIEDIQNAIADLDAQING